MAKRLALIVLIATVLIGGLLYSQRRTGPLKVSGFLESDEIRVGSRVGGRVLKVLVDEGDVVQRGAPLVELEPFQLHEQKAQAEGQLAQAEAELSRLEKGYQDEEIAASQAALNQLIAAREILADGEEDITAAQSNLDLAKAQLELATLTYKRTEGLFAKNSASQLDMDQATTETRVARATVRVREEELARLKRTRPTEIKQADAKKEEARQQFLMRERGYRTEDKAKARAAVAAARAALDVIERQIEELTVRAPANGAIEAIDLRPGDLVSANAPAISLEETSRLWVRAYVPENHLNLKVGDTLRITVDSYPGKTFRGRLGFVARQAEFTPGNVQTPEERSKQVFRIKVYLEDGLDQLRAGMSADVWLEGEGAGK